MPFIFVLLAFSGGVVKAKFTGWASEKFTVFVPCFYALERGLGNMTRSGFKSMLAHFGRGRPCCCLCELLGCGLR